MTINKFETRINFLTALKNIDKYRVTNVTQKGDFEIRSDMFSLLIEVKAKGTSGKKDDINCSSTIVINAAKQLSENTKIFDGRIVYVTNYADADVTMGFSNNILSN